MPHFALRSWLAAAAVVALLHVADSLAGFREVEIKTEPESQGAQVYNCRLLPDRTEQCSLIMFECVYRQEYPWESSDGKTATKVTEPATFAYREKDVKLVDDLNRHISFKVPVAMERLVAIHGRHVFNTNFPVVVDRVRITVHPVGAPKWTFEAATDAITEPRAPASAPK